MHAAHSRRAFGRPVANFTVANLATVLALLVIAALYTYHVVAIFARPNWAYLPIVAAPLLCAALVATGRPWTPLLAPLMALFVLTSPVRADIPYNLARPAETRYFVYTLSLLAALGVSVTVGLGATVRQRYPGLRASALLPAAVVAGLLLGPLLGGVLRAAAPQADASAGFSATELAALPTFAMEDTAYTPSLIEVRANQAVAIRFANSGLLPHAFDLDGTAVQLRVPSGRSGVARFTPPVPGTYTFYCSVGDHRAAGMVGILKVLP